MKQQLVGSVFFVGALLSACIFFRAAAQDPQGGSNAPAMSKAAGVGQGDPSRTAGAPVQAEDRKAESNIGSIARYSAGVDEILNMVQAGVSTEIIKAYIENSPIAYNLSATDVIALKEHKVPDELTTALMKRGAALRTQAQQAVTLAATRRAYSGANRRSFGLDPESYDYFHYYYLYPRTLAAANQSFYSSGTASPGFTPYGYGPYGPPVFWPLPPSAFGHP